jgi:hypothetical protein
MDARVKTATLHGLQGRVLEVTAHAEPGLPGLEQRGMPGWGLGQRAERVWAAVTASGLPWPGSKVTVTVAPNWLPKHDSAVDLAIAVAVLAADGTVPACAAAGMMYYAGLGTNGCLLPTPGVLQAAGQVAKAGCRALVVATENTAEALTLNRTSGFVLPLAFEPFRFFSSASSTSATCRVVMTTIQSANHHPGPLRRNASSVTGGPHADASSSSFPCQSGQGKA